MQNTKKRDEKPQGLTTDQIDRLMQLSLETNTMMEVWIAMVTDRAHQLSQPEKDGLAFMSRRITSDLERLTEDILKEWTPPGER